MPPEAGGGLAGAPAGWPEPAPGADGGAVSACGLGKGTALGDSVSRYAITSARCLSFDMPAKVIAVPGANVLGLVSQVLSVSKSQLPFFDFSAAE